MTLEDLKKYFGNGNRFEIETGMSHANWFNWFNKYGYVPLRSQKRLEKITRGKLIASFEDIPEVK